MKSSRCIAMVAQRQSAELWVQSPGFKPGSGHGFFVSVRSWKYWPRMVMTIASWPGGSEVKWRAANQEAGVRTLRETLLFGSLI